MSRYQKKNNKSNQKYNKRGDHKRNNKRENYNHNLRTNDEIIEINENHPIFKEYKKMDCIRPYGIPEFYFKNQRAENTRFYYHAYLVDQNFFNNLRDNIYLFRIRVGYISPLFYGKWFDSVVDKLESSLDFTHLESDATTIYYNLLCSFMKNYDYWKPCEYDSPQKCLESNKKLYCKGYHGTADKDYPELAHIGFCHDDILPDNWSWIKLIGDCIDDEDLDRIHWHQNSLLPKGIKT